MTMGDTQQPEPDGTGATGAEAAAALAEIRRRQEHVIKAALVPLWYWWAMAAAVIAIGIADDSGKSAVKAITIPLAYVVIIGLSISTAPAVRRRVRVNSATQPNNPRAVAAIFGMIVLVNVVAITTALSLAAAHVPHPATIGCAAGAAVLVIVGPLVNRYLRRLMLSRGRKQMTDAPRPEEAPHEHGSLR
jgi:hypothetical protein